MPMYSFVCQACGQAFDKKLRMSQAGDPQVCPVCGSGETRKRIGSVASVGGSARSAAAAIPAPPVSSPFS
ncbi:MAG: zinc ribbon domain-containing protein [Anaerolineae bacterium]